jgi:hypothetical protein
MYDGMADFGLTMRKRYWPAVSLPEWAASHADEANFIDHTKAAYFVSEAHIIVDNLAS